MERQSEERKRRDQPEVSITVHLSARRGPRHVTELLPCGGSRSLAALHPPDSLSPCLQWLPARQFTFNYLLSQTHSEEVQKHSIKTFWRFLSLKTLLWSPRMGRTNLRLRKIQDYERVLHQTLSPSDTPFLHMTIEESLSSLCLDGHYVSLKEECWSKTCILIYDVRCYLTFLPQRYCQGAMVIRQHIRFSQSGLRHSSISVYYQTTSNRRLHLLCFMHLHEIQLCRICR